MPGPRLCLEGFEPTEGCRTTHPHLCTRAAAAQRLLVWGCGARGHLPCEGLLTGRACELQLGKPLLPSLAQDCCDEAPTGIKHIDGGAP